MARESDATTNAVGGERGTEGTETDELEEEEGHQQFGEGDTTWGRRIGRDTAALREEGPGMIDTAARRRGQTNAARQR